VLPSRTVCGSEGSGLGSLLHGRRRAVGHRDEHRLSTVAVRLVVTTDNHTGTVVGNLDGRRARELPSAVGVCEFAAAESRAVQSFDLPPVRVAVLVVVVVVERDVEADALAGLFDADARDVRLAEVEFVGPIVVGLAGVGFAGRRGIRRGILGPGGTAGEGRALVLATVARKRRRNTTAASFSGPITTTVWSGSPAHLSRVPWYSTPRLLVARAILQTSQTPDSGPKRSRPDTRSPLRARRFACGRHAGEPQHPPAPATGPAGPDSTRAAQPTGTATKLATVTASPNPKMARDDTDRAGLLAVSPFSGVRAARRRVLRGRRRVLLPAGRLDSGRRRAVPRHDGRPARLARFHGLWHRSDHEPERRGHPSA